MIEVRYLRKMIDGVPVMATPPEIDVTTAEQLRAVLLAATENRYRTLVADMTRTRFCDSAAVHALIAAHKRVLAEGGGLRLVVPADGAVHRVLTLLGIDHFIHCFASLEEAVAPASDGACTGDPIPVDQTRTAIRSSRDRAVSALLIFSLRSREWPGAWIDHNFANIFSPGWLVALTNS